MLAKDIQIGDRLMSLIDRGNHIKKGDILTVKRINKIDWQAQILVYKTNAEALGTWTSVRCYTKVGHCA